MPVPTPTPDSGSLVVGENRPNPSAAVSKLSVAKQAAAVTAPASIEAQDRLFPAGIALVACSYTGTPGLCFLSLSLLCGALFVFLLDLSTFLSVSKISFFESSFFFICHDSSF